MLQTLDIYFRCMDGLTQVVVIGLAGLSSRVSSVMGSQWSCCRMVWCSEQIWFLWWYELLSCAIVEVCAGFSCVTHKGRRGSRPAGRWPDCRLWWQVWVLQRWCVFVLVSCKTSRSRSTWSTLGCVTRQMRWINTGVNSSMRWVVFILLLCQMSRAVDL